MDDLKGLAAYEFFANYSESDAAKRNTDLLTGEKPVVGIERADKQPNSEGK